MNKILIVVSILLFCSPGFAANPNETWHDFELFEYEFELAGLNGIEDLKIEFVRKVIKSVYVLSFYYNDRIENKMHQVSSRKAGTQDLIEKIALGMTSPSSSLCITASDIYFQTMIKDHLKKLNHVTSRMALYKYWDTEPVNFALAVSQIPENELDKQLMHARVLINSGVGKDILIGDFAEKDDDN